MKSRLILFFGIFFFSMWVQAQELEDTPRSKDTTEVEAEKPEKKKSAAKTFRSLLGPEAKNAWRKKGFRLRAGFGSEYRYGHGLAPTNWAHGLTFEPTYQLDADWALGVQLSYAINAAEGEFTGLMWNTFLNTQVRLVQHLMLSFGVGIAGILGNPPPSKVRQDDSLEEKAFALGSRMAAPGQEITSCYGYGPAANLNLTYISPLTPYFSAGPVFGVKAQHVQCSETGLGAQVNLETGRGIDVWQWWAQTMPYAGLYLAWR